MRFLVVYGFDFDGTLHQTGPSKKMGLCDWPLWDEKYREWQESDDPGKGSFTQWSNKRTVKQGLYWPNGAEYSTNLNPIYGKDYEPAGANHGQSDMAGAPTAG